MVDTESPNHASGAFEIAGKQVHRLGFGAMRLTGQGIWGPPEDREECIRVVRRAVELGVELIDTADSYGPYVSEGDHPRGAAPLSRQRARRDQGRPRAPRPRRVAAGRATGVPCARGRDEPAPPRRRAPRPVPAAPHRREGATGGPDRRTGRSADEGKIGAIGLSEVTVEQLDAVRKQADIATVQNLYNLANRKSEDVVDYCTREGIGFIPWFPINAGSLAKAGGPVDEIAEATSATYSQVALAWLLARAQVILPIPGTSSVAHLEENLGAAGVHLSPQQVAQLTDAATEG